MLEELIMSTTIFVCSLILVILIYVLPRKNEKIYFSKAIKYGEFKSSKIWWEQSYELDKQIVWYDWVLGGAEIKYEIKKDSFKKI